MQHSTIQTQHSHRLALTLHKHNRPRPGEEEHSRQSCFVSGKFGGAPLSLFFCPALEYAGVLGKGIIHKLLHTARLLLLGGLPQLVVVPLNPPVQKTNTLPAEELSRTGTTLPVKNMLLMHNQQDRFEACYDEQCACNDGQAACAMKDRHSA